MAGRASEEKNGQEDDGEEADEGGGRGGEGQQLGGRAKKKTRVAAGQPHGLRLPPAPTKISRRAHGGAERSQHVR